MFPNWQNRKSDGVNRGPSCSDSARNGSTSHPPQSFPLTRIQTAFVVLDHAIPACVVALLDRRCPMTVVGGIGTVVVDPVDGMLQRRSTTHVGKEVCVAIITRPPITNNDTSTAIQAEPLALGIRTARMHGAPDLVLPSGGMVDRISVSSEAESHLLSFFASTRGRASLRKLRSANVLDCSAITPCAPIEPPSGSPDKRNHRPAVESLPGKILEWCHDAPPSSVLLGGMGAGVEGTRFSGATLALIVNDMVALACQDVIALRRIT